MLFKTIKKKLRFWSKITNKKRKNRKPPSPDCLLGYSPPRPTCQNHFICHPPQLPPLIQPSAPPLPPWLETAEQQLKPSSGFDFISGTEINETKSVEATTATVLQQPYGPQILGSYQQYMAVNPVADYYAYPPLRRQGAGGIFGGLFGCAVGVSVLFIRCFCPCFKILELGYDTETANVVVGRGTVWNQIEY